MQSKDYWLKRALQREAEAFQSTNDTVRRLRSIYDSAAARLSRVVKTIFANYQKSGGIDADEARRLLTVQETAEVLESLRKEYADTGDASLLARLSAPAYAYRINRAQAMRKAIEAETEWVNDRELRAGAQRLTETYDASYHKTFYDTAQLAEKDIDFTPLPQRAIQQAVENRWKGENYSERVWKNTHLVAKEAGAIIDEGISSGASVAQMAHDIKDLFDVASYAAERLVRTEINRMHNDAALRSYKTMGVEEYTFLATLDARTCLHCGEKDGKHFKVSEARTGENLPPLHPNDRCTTVAYYPDEDRQGTRIAKNPDTGKNYKVDRHMTYEKWRKEVGTDALEAAQKRYRNLKRDTAEQREIQKVLGNKVPPKIAEYQDLKYNEPEKYEKLRRNSKTFQQINQGGYSDEYKKKLKSTYRYFDENGFEFTEHALNRTVGQKQSSGKVTFTQEELLGILRKAPNYEQSNGHKIRFYDGISVIQAADTGEIVSIVTRKMPKADWRGI